LKVQIISVESSDDLASLRDKVLRAQASLILLHAASPCPVIRRRLDLILMRRWAISVGSSLALATEVRPLQKLAKEIRIPCFPSLEKALWASRGPLPARLPEVRSASPPTGDWGRDQHETEVARAAVFRTPESRRFTKGLLRTRDVQGPELGRFRVLVFSLGAGLLLLPLLLGIPGATVRLRLPTRPVAASARLLSFSGATLSAAVQVSGRRLSSGQETVPTQSASGFVQIRNKSSDTLLLPPGLEIQAGSLPTLFVTSSAATLAPQQMVWVDVRAAQAGAQANLPADSLSAVEGPLGLVLQVGPSTAMRGGQSERRAIVTAEDLQSLRKQLEGELRAEALFRLQAEAPSGSLLVPETLSLEGQAESKADAVSGTPLDSVGMTLSADATILSFHSSDLEKIGAQALSQRTGPAETLDLSPMGMSLSGTPSGNAILHVEARAYPAWDPGTLPYALRLLRPHDEGRVLQTRTPPGTIWEVEVWPNWLPFLPPYPWRIHVEAQPA